MSFKNRGRKKEHIGKAMDEIEHAPSFAWHHGRFMESKDIPLPQKRGGGRE